MISADPELKVAEAEVDKALLTAVGFARTKSFSVEKVISCAQIDTVYFCTRPVKVVAQTIVRVGL